MHDSEIATILAMVDTRALSKVATEHHSCVFASLSGAHLYGFASRDSDVDLRGAFLLPVEELAGVRQAKETHSVSSEDHGFELDWVAHDLRKFARMMLQHNGYVLEQLFSPLVVVRGEFYDELKELGQGCFTRGCVRHYRGFAHGRRKRLREPDPTVKHLLYAYRVYFSGIFLKQEHSIESHLPDLLTTETASDFRETVEELMHRKREGTEHMALGPEELSHHESLLDTLEASLVEAHEKSGLPDEPTARDALHDFVVRARLSSPNSH